MDMVMQAKKMLDEQGCKAELIDVAIKEYLNQNSAEVKNVELTKEVLALNEEIKDIKKKSTEFVETISLLLEYIVRIDLSDENGKEKFKKLQHQAQHKLIIINLMKGLCNMNDVKVLSKEEFVKLFKQDQQRKRKSKIKANLEAKDFRWDGRQKNIMSKKRLSRRYY